MLGQGTLIWLQVGPSALDKLVSWGLNPADRSGAPPGPCGPPEAQRTHKLELAFGLRLVVSLALSLPVLPGWGPHPHLEKQNVLETGGGGIKTVWPGSPGPREATGSLGPRVPTSCWGRVFPAEQVVPSLCGSSVPWAAGQV